MPTIRPRLAKPRASSVWIGVVLTLLTACTAERVPVELKFNPILDGRPIACADEDTRLSDLRFFVSEPALLDAAGKQYPVRLLNDGRWQSGNVAMIDLEDAQGACLNGTQAMNSTIRGTVVNGQYVGLRFTMGVPFADNHANPLLAKPPLNDPAMHWHWRSGYKFMRAGISAPSDGFWMHLGSTGCQGTVQNIEKCTAPNRVVVDLPLGTENFQDITIDLSVLAAATDLTDRRASDCSSGPAENACGPIFAAMGLRFGDRMAPGKQQLFKVRR